MDKLANKIYEKKRKLIRRKNRSNERTKVLSDLPRLIVNRSNKFSYVQIVDRSGVVVASFDDRKITTWKKTERAKIVWMELAKKALEKWVKEVVFDRNGYLYHGRVEAIAQWAREWWLKL